MLRRAGIPLTVTLAVVLAAAGIARADELHLKDGTKIVGTIVGYENDSFKVETSYGFAVVRKDRVAEIIPSSPGSPKKESEDSSLRSEKQPPAAETAPSTPGAAPSPSLEAKRELSAAIAPPKPGTAPSIAASKPPVIAAAVPPPAAAPAVLPPPAPPEPPPPPPVIRDEVRGTLYMNHTYGFQMFKPPSWDLMPDERTALPDAIAALGTADQTTLLVIGREHTQDSLDAHANATEKALGEIYENYRAISSRRTNVAGIAAVERRARGLLDEKDWSVILLTFQHGADTYTLLGMTWADSDLIQVQENVSTKTMNSRAFVTPE
jgi:hypothetical protein